MKQKGMIVLSHCGFSFVEDLCGNLKAMGLAAYVLTSKPLKAEKARIEILLQHATMMHATESHVLTEIEVDDFINDLRNQNQDVLACITVWEGYRHIMAKTNIKLNACDLLPEKVELLRDKFSLRKTLNALGLSDVNSTLLSEENFESLKNSNKKTFVKPQLGLASYGAFLLRQDDTWGKIREIQRHIEKDKEYQSAFNNKISFIAEDYIGGIEYSFEIIAWNNTPYVIAIHEKIDLQESGSTTLESACVSSSDRLNKKIVLKATDWLKKIFAALEINIGCYHVEAKYCDGKWEIIEINPRVGGAFISQSVELLLQSDNLLSLWIKTLFQNEKNELQCYLKSISSDDDLFFKRKYQTFFRVYFADSVGTIQSIHANTIYPEPEKIKIFLEPGFNVISLDKEIFLAQALWKLDCLDKSSLDQILENSRQLLEVTYG